MEEVLVVEVLHVLDLLPDLCVTVEDALDQLPGIGAEQVVKEDLGSIHYAFDCLGRFSLRHCFSFCGHSPLMLGPRCLEGFILRLDDGRCQTGYLFFRKFMAADAMYWE